MRLTIWGCRGSVPVVGEKFMRHGGATTCLEVEAGGGRVILDGGTGLVELGRRRELSGCETLVLQTHLHWDHIQGYPFFAGLFDPSARLALWGVDRDGRTLHEVLDEQMRRPTFPIGLGSVPAALDFRSIDPVGSARRGGVEIAWTEMCHPSGCTAYRLEHDGSAVVFSGDVEVAQGCRRRLVEFARGADVLVMDAQYFPDEYPAHEGWGHSTCEEAVEVALEAGVCRLVMTHHDAAHGDEALHAKLELARRIAGGRLLVENAYDGQSTEVSSGDTSHRARVRSTP